MGFLDRLLKPARRPPDVRGPPAVATEPASPVAAPLARPDLSLGDADSEGSGDDLFDLPRSGGSTLSAPLLAPPPRRGALDGGASSDCAASRGSGGGGSALGGALGRGCGVAGASEIEALYCDIALIHRGRHAMIYRGRERRSRRRVVLKAYLRCQRTPARAEALEREQRMLEAAGAHPGVVALDRVLENADATYLVLEGAGCGTLIEVVASSGGHLPERAAARRVAAPLLRALAHLHGRGIVHRDVKPEHILLTADGLRLADFSTAARLPHAPWPPPAPAPEMRKRSAELRRSIEALHARHRRNTSVAGSARGSGGGGGSGSAASSGPGGDAAGVSSPLLNHAAASQQQQQQQHHHHHPQQLGGGGGGSDSGALKPQAVAAQLHPQPGEQPGGGGGGGGGGGPGTRDVLNARVGSLEYMAPEVLDKPTPAEIFHLVLAHGMDEEELPVYDEKADIWSLGAVVYEALTGRQPFLADDAAEMAALVAARLSAVDAGSGLPAFLAAEAALSPECKSFVAACMRRDAAARPSAGELLQHPWLSRRASAAEGDDASAAAAAGVAGALSRCMSHAPQPLGGGGGLCFDAAAATLLSPAAPLLPGGSDATLGGGGGVRRSLSAPLFDADMVRPAGAGAGALDAGRPPMGAAAAAAPLARRGGA